MATGEAQNTLRKAFGCWGALLVRFRWWKSDVWSRYLWWTDREERIARTYPPALYKACSDYFDYALKLKSGEVWYFREAKPISREWVMLSDFDNAPSQDRHETEHMPFERGVDVRVSEIVWVADAPNGS